MSHLEANLAALLPRLGEADRRRLAAASPSPSARIVATPSGFPTATVGGSLVHSRYYPPREAARAAAV